MNANEYSEAGFARGVLQVIHKAGRQVLLSALELKVAVTSKEMPAWAKGVALGAIAYLFMPLDTIPDFTPIAGFADDLGALSAALAAIGRYISPEIKRQAEEELKKLGA